MGRNTRITVEITHLFTQIISENIQLKHGIVFQVPEHCKISYPRKPQRYRDVHVVISIPKIDNSRRRDDTEEQEIPLFPEFINQSAANQSNCFLFLVSYLGKSLDQADACHLASVYRGFCSIWNTHFCLRLQPHLYPVPVETSVGRSDGTRQRYKSTHVQSEAPVSTRIIVELRLPTVNDEHIQRTRPA